MQKIQVSLPSTSQTTSLTFFTLGTRGIDLSGERGRVVRGSGLRCQVSSTVFRDSFLQLTQRHCRSFHRAPGSVTRAQCHVYPAAWRWAAWEARECVFVVVCAVEG
jgi:hypothetical protein